jgi:beta-lactamase regulating signal transducer with metallopeptidase domain/Flp pilus assembly protein TadD
MATIFELAEQLQSAGAAENMLWIVVKAALILAIARLLLMVMPRAAAATRHLVATVALVAVAAMPVMTVVVPAWEIAVRESASPAPLPAPVAAASEAAAAQDVETIGVSDSDTLNTAISLVRVTGAAVAAEPLTALQRAREVALSTWKGMLVLAVAAVAAAMLLHMFLGMAGVAFVARKASEVEDERILRSLDEARGQLGLSSDVRVLRSSRISVPVVWGILRPVLLLPPDVVTWPDERLRVVLLHELAHLKRLDGLSLIATRISVSLFWFLPLAWSLERAGRSECERACDDLVLAGGTKPSDYADHLLAIARSMPGFDPFRSVTLAMSRKSQLEGRLLSILQRDVTRRVLSGRGVAIACALAVVVAAPFAALRIVAEPAKPTPAPAPAEAGSIVTVTPQIESIEDAILTKIGKLSKAADKWASTPETAEEWYERAYDLYRADRYPEAAAAFRTAAEGGHTPDRALYNAACSYALAGDADRALATLGEAIAAGWDDIEHIAEDSDFDSLRSDPRLARVVGDQHSDLVSRRETEVMRRYDRLRSAATPPKGEKWFKVGVDLLSLRRLDQAIHSFEQAVAAGEKTGAAMYNLACAYSLRGDVRTGMSWLDRAIENGFSDKDKLRRDPDINLLRQQQGFEALVTKAADLELRTHRFGWVDTARRHRELAEKHPTSGRAWFNLGYAALQERDFDTARAAFERAIALDYRASTSSYNMACAFALQGNKDAAFQWLDRAKAAGFDLHDHMEDDEDLDALRSDPRWQTYLP